MRRLAVLIPLLILLCACTPTPLPTETATVTTTATSTVTATVTPTATPTATATPVVCATCPPTATPARGWVVIHSDEIGDYTVQATPVMGVVLVWSPRFHVGEPSKYITIETGAGGVAVKPMAPGEYILIDDRWPDGWIPAIRTDGSGRPDWLGVSPDGDTYLWFLGMRRPTPVPTHTPTVTATPTMHTCPDVEQDCLAVTSCPSGRVQDPLGRCGSGFVCCVPVTATPTRSVP